MSENEYSALEQERLEEEKRHLDKRLKEVQSMGDFVRLGSLLEKRQDRMLSSLSRSLKKAVIEEKSEKIKSDS